VEEVEYMMGKMVEERELIWACYRQLIALLTTPAVPHCLRQLSTTLLLALAPRPH
jgi:hypothetical protein